MTIDRKLKQLITRTYNEFKELTLHERIEHEFKESILSERTDHKLKKLI